MAWTKMKTVAVVGVTVLLVALIATIVIKKHSRARPSTRGSAVRLLLWPAERKRETARIESRQHVDETVNATTIDLRPFINAKLTDAPSGGKGNNDDNLAELPDGKHLYAGVPFDVSGSIQLMGGWMKHFDKTYPAEVDDIPIDRLCAKIHLFHGDSYVADTNFGTVVSKLILHYADNRTRELDLVAGQQSFDWWFPLFRTGIPARYFQLAPGTERAWTGSNPHVKKWQPECSLILYKTTFENPRPDVKVSTVDFVSTETMTCPFLVGLTVE